MTPNEFDFNNMPKEPENPEITPLLKRVFLFLEDGEFDKADQYCEKVLDADPEKAEAYLGKLMVQVKVRKKEDLAHTSFSFELNPNYQKIMRFGDESLKNELQGYVSKRTENLRSIIFGNAVNAMNNAKSSDDCSEAIRLFEKVSDFENAGELIIQCEEKRQLFLAEEATARSEREQQAVDKKEKRKKKAKKVWKVIISVAASIIGLVLLIPVVFNLLIPMIRYEQAKKYLKDGKIEKAYYAFNDAADFKDSHEYLANFEVLYEKEEYIDYENEEYSNTTERTFDAKGNLIKEIETYGDSDPRIIEYTYDSNGKLLKKTRSYSTTEYTYDSNGNVLKEVVYYEYSDPSITEYTYDGNGILLKEVSPYATVEYSYDDNGNVSESIYIDSDGKKSTHEYRYTKYGRIKYHKYISEDRESEYSYTYGFLTGKTYNYVYSNEDEERCFKYFYDLFGLPYKRISEEDGEKIMYTKLKFDIHMNCIEETEYDEDGDVIARYECEYDKNGIRTKLTCRNEKGDVTDRYKYKNPHIVYNDSI